MGQDTLDKVRVSAGTASVLGLSRIASFDEPTSAYVMIGERCAHDCAFCAQARSSAAPGGQLSRVTWPEFSADDLARALGAAAGAGRVQRACAQVVGAPGAFGKSIVAVRLLRSAVGSCVPVSVSFSATQTGARSSVSASYTFWSVVSVVPELETYAMMLAGLGLLGRVGNEVVPPMVGK